MNKCYALYKKDSTWKRILKMRKSRLFCLFLCLKKLYQIQYKNTTELHGGYILIPWCELTEQSKVAESARCSSFFSFFPDRGPCNDCL